MVGDSNIVNMFHVDPSHRTPSDTHTIPPAQSSPHPPSRSQSNQPPARLPLRLLPTHTHKALPVTRARSTQPILHQQSRSGRQTGDTKSVISARPRSRNSPSQVPAQAPLKPVSWRGSPHARNRPFLALHDDGSVHGSSSAIRSTTTNNYTTCRLYCTRKCYVGFCTLRCT